MEAALSGQPFQEGHRVAGSSSSTWQLLHEVNSFGGKLDLSPLTLSFRNTYICNNKKTEALSLRESKWGGTWEGVEEEKKGENDVIMF